MAVAKPTVTPDWVNDANAAIVDPDTAIILDPGPTLRADGWPVQAKVDAQHINWLFRIIWTWIRWLQDITNQALTWADVHIFQAKVTFQAAIAHGQLTLTLPAAVGVSAQWTIQSTPGAGGPVYWISPGDASLRDVIFPIPLKVGDRIISITAYVKDHNAAGVMAVKGWKNTSAGVQTQLGATVNSANNGLNQSLQVAGFTETVAAGTHYHVTITSDTGSNDQRVYGVSVVYDRP